MDGGPVELPQIVERRTAHCFRKASRGIFFFLWAGLFAAPTLRAADVALDAVLKLWHYQQSSAGAPVIPTTNGYSFQALVVATTNNVVTGAVVRLPNFTTKTLLYESEYNFRFEQRFNTSSALDAAYPQGSLFTEAAYQMQMQTVHDGLHANNCTYAATILGLGNYPNTPQIQNWSAAQQIDHTRGFTLQWNNLGGNVNDIVQLAVFVNETNGVFASALPLTTNALNGASNSVVIPGYQLPPGTNLTAHLIILHVAGIPDQSYALGVAILGKETIFPMQTRATPPAPTLELLARTNGATQLRLTGETNRTYQIQATENWNNWTTLFTTNSASGKFSHADTSPSNALRFYRGRVGD